VSHPLNACRKGKATHLSELKARVMSWVSEAFAQVKTNPQFVNAELLNCYYGQLQSFTVN